MRSLVALSLAVGLALGTPTITEAAANPAFVASVSGSHAALGKIPDGYSAHVELDPGALFALKPGAAVQLDFPRLGSVVVVLERIRAVDLSSRVVRWEGHLQDSADMQVLFVKGLSGSVTGSVDTPAGRLLLGQLGGYMVYPESQTTAARERAEPQGELPQALFIDERPSLQLQSAKPAHAAYPVEFNVAGLADVALDEEVEVTLPGVGNFTVIHDATRAGQAGAATFVGYLKDYGDDFRMLVTYSATGAEGRILTPHGEFLLRMHEGQLWLIDVERSGLYEAPPAMVDALPPEKLKPGEPIMPAGHNMNHTMAMGAMTPAGSGHGDTMVKDVGVSGSGAVVGAMAGDGATQVDVLVLYTAGLKTARGGEAQAQARLQYLVAAANQAYVDSGVNMELHLVGMVEVAGPDDSNSESALIAMTNGAAPFQTAQTLRDQYGADLVALVRPFSNNQGGMCGVGWVGGYGGSSIASYVGYGYSVVSDATIAGQQFCSDYTFAHELAHNMGTMHDRATVASQGGGTGAFPFAFGYGVNTQFGTIMSYISPRIGKFSNPANTCAGVPCGVSENDASNSANNALALNLAKADVASFKGAAAPGNVYISGVVSSNGSAVASVSFTATSPATCSNSASNGVFSCTVPNGWSGSVTPSRSGYTFNPTSLSYSGLTQNQASQNFTATATDSGSGSGTSSTGVTPIPGGVTVTGVVSEGSKKISGVSFTVTGGGRCSSTDASGKFTCSVPKGWTGTLTPKAANYKFSPTSRKLSKTTSNKAGQNFVAKDTRPVPITVSGVISAGSVKLAGVGVSATGGAQCTATDITGSFTCTATKGWSGTITPKANGYKFTPPSRKLSKATGNKAGQNFTGKQGS